MSANVLRVLCMGGCMVYAKHASFVSCEREANVHFGLRVFAWLFAPMLLLK